MRRRRRPWPPAQRELTVRVRAPWHRRSWLVSGRQAEILRAAYAHGWEGTQEELAELVGYRGRSGSHDGIESLITGRILTKATRRGCQGSTRLRVPLGVFLEETAARVAELVEELAGQLALGLDRSRPAPELSP